MSAPRVLAIDVSGPGGGAALLGEKGLHVELVPPAVRRGRDLVPKIRLLLAEEGLETKGLSVIACGIGPGSFTGIRIGIATAAALAYAAGLPVLGLSSLAGVAANAPKTARRVAVLLDARQGRVFRGRFVREGEALVAEGEDDCPLVADALAALEPGTFVLGDARAKYEELLAFPGEALAPVRPDVLAHLAAARFAAGERMSPEALRPLYLRASDPEIKKSGSIGGPPHAPLS